MAWDAIIIGAGAAGLMCAAVAGGRGRRVLLLDHANKPGKKILMSGGGRCNFTNMTITPDHYLSDNPHFCKSALSRYTQWDFIDLVNRHEIPWHEKELGQLFCDNKSSDILNMLLQECATAGVTLQMDSPIEQIEPMDSGFRIRCRGQSLTCASLVIATGGLSIPTMGASGFGYQWAEKMGLTVTRRTASLVPLTLSGHWHEIAQSLSGVSVRAAVSTTRNRFTNQLLFTHRGMSGPSVLQASNYWELGEPVTIDFLPDESLELLIARWQELGSKQTLKTLLGQLLPKRFVQAWLENVSENKPVLHYNKKEIQQIHQDFHNWTLTPSGTEGYRTAEVTRGGVNTDDISSKTFEAKAVKGLYFIGEVLDVTGWLGGYNFQWAWSSGWCAGQAL